METHFFSLTSLLPIEVEILCEEISLAVCGHQRSGAMIEDTLSVIEKKTTYPTGHHIACGTVMESKAK
jgi:hypothetical protein